MAEPTAVHERGGLVLASVPHLRRIARSFAIRRFAAAEPLTSAPVPRERDREADFRRVLFERRAVRFAVRLLPRRFRRRPPPLRRPPSAFAIICACAPVTSPGIRRTDLSPMFTFH